MLPLTGYADRLSARAGETITFHIANATGAEVRTTLVRVICADPNPAAGGVRTAQISQAGLTTLATAAPQVPRRGSFARVDNIAPIHAAQSFSLVLAVWPSRLTGAAQTIVSCLDERKASGFALALDANGRLVCALGLGGGVTERMSTKIVLPLHAWSRLLLTYDQAAQELQLHSLSTGTTTSSRATFDHPMHHGADAPLSFAADPTGEAGHFNGRIGQPAFYDRILDIEDMAAAAKSGTLDTVGFPGRIAAWDFAQEMATTRIIDIGPHGLHGRLVNGPTRAVRGMSWTGREQCFRHARDQYGAIHFHDDDVDGMGWPATHAFTLPADLPSGAYALMIEAGDARDNIPFFAVPPKGTQSAKLAVLVSTLTYTVYGNHARPEWFADPQWRAAWVDQAAHWGAYPSNPAEHPEYGLSTYNHHSDGSGIAFASWHRPMLNLRIGYFTYPYPGIRGSGLRHYPADSHLLAWLEAKGQPYDLVTDWELHHEGVDLLSRYACVLTGTHPEYHTTQMLDALEAYRDGGGRLMYLGRNGFYWKIALSPETPGLIEIRRAEGGIRAWAAEPGEYYNQFDSEYGGLWRRNARPPQQLVGVGFTAQGNFTGSHYRMTLAGRTNPRTAWMFDGIATETIGGFGFSGHGAAGFELDRADTRLGTPNHAIVVAQSENHPPEAPWMLVPEEQLTHITTIPGQSHRQLIRADMTFFEAPHNGAVFSTGSITFCGSLPHAGFDNDISTLLANVVRRFLDPAAVFSVPAPEL